MSRCGKFATLTAKASILTRNKPRVEILMIVQLLTQISERSRSQTHEDFENW